MRLPHACLEISSIVLLSLLLKFFAVSFILLAVGSPARTCLLKYRYVCRTGFETTNGFTIKDLSTGGVMSTQVDYLVTMYSNSDGQKYVSYDLMSVPDNRDAVNRMRVFGTGMMTVPYNTVQNGKIGIGKYP